MPPTIAALPTIYKGHEFRSRLEARWAIFFDCMGWKWEYEPEAVQTRHGGYLVDFWLPAHEVYAEVKPGEFTTKEFDKACDLVDKSGRSLLILSGEPQPLLSYYVVTNEFEQVWEDEVPTERTERVIRNLLLFEYSKGHLFCSDGMCKWYSGSTLPVPLDGHGFPTTALRAAEVTAAAHAARTARFDNGHLAYVAGDDRIQRAVGLA
jgi:hypothetical protein